MIHAKKAVQGFQKGLDKLMKDNPDITLLAQIGELGKKMRIGGS